MTIFSSISAIRAPCVVPKGRFPANGNERAPPREASWVPPPLPRFLPGIKGEKNLQGALFFNSGLFWLKKKSNCDGGLAPTVRPVPAARPLLVSGIECGGGSAAEKGGGGVGDRGSGGRERHKAQAM